MLCLISSSARRISMKNNITISSTNSTDIRAIDTFRPNPTIIHTSRRFH